MCLPHENLGKEWWAEGTAYGKAGRDEVRWKKRRALCLDRSEYTEECASPRRGGAGASSFQPPMSWGAQLTTSWREMTCCIINPGHIDPFPGWVPARLTGGLRSTWKCNSNWCLAGICLRPCDTQSNYVEQISFLFYLTFLLSLLLCFSSTTCSNSCDCLWLGQELRNVLTCSKFYFQIPSHCLSSPHFPPQLHSALFSIEKHKDQFSSLRKSLHVNTECNSRI